MQSFLVDQTHPMLVRAVLQKTFGPDYPYIPFLRVNGKSRIISIERIEVIGATLRLRVLQPLLSDNSSLTTEPMNISNDYLSSSKIMPEGGAVAEWSKALLKKEKINENLKDPRFPSRPGHL